MFIQGKRESSLVRWQHSLDTSLRSRANFVELEDGTIRRLLPNNLSQRTAVAKLLLTREKQHENTTLMSTKRVYRHLRNGDYVLANRQPTLHRPSIQAHMVSEPHSTLVNFYGSARRKDPATPLCSMQIVQC
jgi:hypothetical protein